MEKQQLAEHRNEIIRNHNDAVSDTTQNQFGQLTPTAAIGREAGLSTDKVARKLARLDGQGGGQAVLRRSILTSVKSNQQRAIIARSVVQRQLQKLQGPTDSVVLTNIDNIGKKTDHLYADKIPGPKTPVPPGVPEKDKGHFLNLRRKKTRKF